MANSRTTKTIVTALPRLKLLVALTTALGWKLISPISMPIGLSRFSSSSIFCLPIPNRHDIGTLHSRDAEADSWLAVVSKDATRWIFIAALDRSDIFEKKLASCAVGSDRELKHLFC